MGPWTLPNQNFGETSIKFRFSWVLPIIPLKNGWTSPNKYQNPTKNLFNQHFSLRPLSPLVFTFRIPSPPAVSRRGTRSGSRRPPHLPRPLNAARRRSAWASGGFGPGWELMGTGWWVIYRGYPLGSTMGMYISWSMDIIEYYYYCIWYYWDIWGFPQSWGYHKNAGWFLWTGKPK